MEQNRDFICPYDKSVRTAAPKGPDGLVHRLTRAAQAHAPDPVARARLILAEQRQHFDAIRTAILQMGQTLDHLNTLPSRSEAPQPHTMALLNAQAEAIQSLTLLALKGQQMQTELIGAIDVQAQRMAALRVPRWSYCIVGGLLLAGLVALMR